jgi:hypothetical protein
MPRICPPLRDGHIRHFGYAPFAGPWRHHQRRRASDAAPAPGPAPPLAGAARGLRAAPAAPALGAAPARRPPSAPHPRRPRPPRRTRAPAAPALRVAPATPAPSAPHPRPRGARPSAPHPRRRGVRALRAAPPRRPRPPRRTPAASVSRLQSRQIGRHSRPRVPPSPPAALGVPRPRAWRALAARTGFFARQAKNPTCRGAPAPDMSCTTAGQALARAVLATERSWVRWSASGEAATTM